MAWLKPALRSAALMVMLLVSEAFAVVHPLDLDAHATDEVCKICISVASLGAADVADGPVFLVDRSSPNRWAELVVAAESSTRANYFARAPPNAS